MSDEPLHVQINKKFLSNLKSTKAVSREIVDKLEAIINAPILDDKKLEELLCKDETKKT